MGVGRPRNIESPMEMWDLFVQYVDWAKSNPIKAHDFVGKNGDEVYREKERPLTYEGFSVYLENEGVITTPDHYFINYQGRYSDFIGVCSRIKRAIRADQIEGGMAGIYNPSITQRLNGLVDKKEEKNEGKMEVVVTYESKNNTQRTAHQPGKDDAGKEEV